MFLSFLKFGIGKMKVIGPGPPCSASHSIIKTYYGVNKLWCSVSNEINYFTGSCTDCFIYSLNRSHIYLVSI
jgi:hypothetical protein